MRWIPPVLLCVLLSVRVGICLSQPLDNAVLSQGDALIRAGRADEAWQRLAPLEWQYAGQPDFDYLLALAALESGRPNRATFILERVITVNPRHVAARLAMARALFALRDYERAEREFNFILNSDPPADTRSLVHAYLAKMAVPVGPVDSGFRAYVELAVGRDTNVSAGAAQDSVFIPGLGADFVPDSMFRRRPDDFLALGGGMEYAHALATDLSVVGGADFRQRWHSDVDAFDARAADLHVTLVHRLDHRDRMQYAARHNQYDLDNARYRETQSLAGQWSRSFSQRARITALAQGYRIRYLQEHAKASSSNLLAAGASATYAVDQSARTVAAVAVSVGRDSAVAGRADGDRRVYGFGVGLQRRLASRLEGYARYSVLNSDYETENPDFRVMRRDRQHDAALGLAWHIADGWSLRPQIARTSHHSNLPLNEYRRTETSVTLRRVWD
jgi:hypothetical protein